jgi:hypothetical protein
MPPTCEVVNTTPTDNPEKEPCFSRDSSRISRISQGFSSPISMFGITCATRCPLNAHSPPGDVTPVGLPGLEADPLPTFPTLGVCGIFLQSTYLSDCASSDLLSERPQISSSLIPVVPSPHSLSFPELPFFAAFLSISSATYISRAAFRNCSPSWIPRTPQRSVSRRRRLREERHMMPLQLDLARRRKDTAVGSGGCT